MSSKNLLVELFVEELPPKALKKLGEAFAGTLAASLKAQGLAVADAAKEPLRDFLVRHSSAHERAFFLKTAQKTLSPERASQISERDFVVVVPAFTVSELSAAFQIGFLIFLPFLIIDLVIANILTAMGMMMLSPTTISLPFKLLLFVLIDGWALLMGSLAASFG